MCHTAFQKYTGCRLFRQHYIYRDIQCEEMRMWSKLFKKEVWCRRIYEQGTTPFADDERRAGPPNFPSPIIVEAVCCYRSWKEASSGDIDSKNVGSSPALVGGACEQDIRADKPAKMDLEWGLYKRDVEVRMTMDTTNGPDNILLICFVLLFWYLSSLHIEPRKLPSIARLPVAAERYDKMRDGYTHKVIDE
ncbi:hypothetical protein PILCRDRAFT_87557 [Piloderma croceum F 1598]|uniref:Uncharacterized protein n=1 Tax=Piloderma croceum (strain F 1598) TaxID=765440 RepID=A0A0C3G2B8_PILCF|nr:hypothetical protein PILCRDRAFT_87557 [Piloderma croceum F 1598]